MAVVCQYMTPASTSTATAMMVSPTGGRGLVARPAGELPPLIISREPELFQDSFDAGHLVVQKRLVGVTGKRDPGPVRLGAGLCPLRRCRHLLHQRDHC